MALAAWLRYTRILCLFLGLSGAAALPPSAVAGDKDKERPPVVLGFERFHTGAEAAFSKLQGGRMLLQELNCLSCHTGTLDSGVTPRQAPILDGVGQRVQASYLRRFLLDPGQTKPGTPMPNVLAGLEEKERGETVEALVHFLAATAAPKQEKPEKKSVGVGRVVYQQIGCVACHGPRNEAGEQDKQISNTLPLGDVKAKYTLLGLRTFLENPLHTRPAGRMPLLLDGKNAQAVANYLLQGVHFASTGVNMSYSYYEGSWTTLPDFSKLKPIATGKAEAFDVGVARRVNDCGLVFEGYLRLERDGDYRFYLNSDDGSKLSIGDKVVVDNDGVHPPTVKMGSAKLTKGVHKLVVSVFNGGGGFELDAQIEGNGLPKQSLSPFIFLTPEGNPPSKVAQPKAGGETITPQPELVAKGRGLFTSLGCASCHQLKESGKQLASTLKAPALDKLPGKGGCLEPTARKGVPHFRLSKDQGTALAAALPMVAGPATAAEIVRHTLVSFNCYACHHRGKIGGVDVEGDHNPYFSTTQPEMGDEGRLPPALDGVGAKLNPDYLRKLLDKGVDDRPYMLTSMPGFGNANVGHLVTAFAGLDTLPELKPITYAEPMSKVKAAARQMTGATGLGCIKCHTFAGNKAEGVQGMDMAIMTQRVKHDWFYHYLENPTKLRPGTRMPTAWPDGKSLLPKVLAGKTDQQIEAIWLYLADGPKAALPVGTKKSFIQLEPLKEAIIYRNFIEGGGPRAIAVGFPEKAHLTFDANEMRLTMLWHGAFMDASRHWTDRGVGYEPPLGDNVLKLPAGVSFAVLEKADEPWPTKSAKEQGYSFRGYRLSADQRPTFLYSALGVKVEDTPNAVASKVLSSMQRTLDMRAETAPANLYFRAYTAKKIEAMEDGWYRIDGDWKLRIQAAEMPRIRQVGMQMELLVPVRFKDGHAKIVQEYAW